ncbi:hypothetical protein NVP1081O_195 [Vibrio phage 1.081.O._10N.286.52.C2]|nr:hypothetical protein NVP1081O_195 [Vibrio phage 1.081.O._10N.286.52.C2]
MVVWASQIAYTSFIETQLTENIMTSVTKHSPAHKFVEGQAISDPRFPKLRFEFVEYRPLHTSRTFDNRLSYQDCVVLDVKDGIKIILDSADFVPA